MASCARIIGFKDDIDDDTVELFYIVRDCQKMYEYLHRDGTWNLWCGREAMYGTKEEAVIMLESLTTQDTLLDIEL